MSPAKVPNGPVHAFDYPLYAVDAVGNNSVVVAGGGGASKTGVPNRLDVVLVNKGQQSHYLSLGDGGGVSAAVGGGGCETGTEAVMSLSVMHSGGASFITTLEGSRCVEYLACLRRDRGSSNADDGPASADASVDRECTVRQRMHKGDQIKDQPTKPNVPDEPPSSPQYWELIKLREFSLPPSLLHSVRGTATPSSSSGKNRPTCVANGGSGAASCVAIGTENGSLFLVNRHSTESLASLLHGDMKLLAVHVDVSGGHKAGVSCLSLSSLKATADGGPRASDWPLLATVCDQPDWTSLRVWRVRTGFVAGHDEDADLSPGAIVPYAVACCSAIAGLSGGAKTDPSSSNRKPVTYRFKHCRFLDYTCQSPKPPSSGGPSAHLLASTVQPLCAGPKSLSHLVMWLMPELAGTDSGAPLPLTSLARIGLPQGHMPACLAVHPSRSRALVGVGTMDGRVEVYFLSPSDHQLSRVYSLDNAHPIFVTALSFLPAWPPALGDSFQLVSVSVDRLLLWHPGPDYFRIACLSRGQSGRGGSGLLARLLGRRSRGLWVLAFGLLMLLPVWVVAVDALLSGWW